VNDCLDVLEYLAVEKVVVLKEVANLTHLVHKSDDASAAVRPPVVEERPDLAKNPELQIRELEPLS